MVKRLALVALVSALVLSAAPALAAPLEPGGTFVDDDGSVHEGSIEAIAAEAITRGCNPPFNDEFCPSSPLTRGQMAALLHRALGGALPEGPTLPFVDIADSVFASDIAWLGRVGVTKGCNPPTNNRFCPDARVTRAQMAAFLVRAFGYRSGIGSNRFIDDDHSIFENDIDRLAAAGVTKGCNPPTNNWFCPGALVTREQMATFLTRALKLRATVPPPRGDLGLQRIGGAFSEPIHVAAPVGDNRVFVVEKRGRIRIVENGTTKAKPFLDISGIVVNSGEKGMMSVVFHPDYAGNGRFFVYHSAALRAGAPKGWNHTSYVVEYRVSSDRNVADPASRRVVMAIDQPRSNHNGGHLLFGPDGKLFVALGDGGGGGDPDENAQDVSNVLGSILRIGVDGAHPYAIPADNPYVGKPGKDEIWLSGVRNPWRIWFDDGRLYVADVGQHAREELTVVDASVPGLNLGWDRLEGSRCYEPASGCSAAGTVKPSLEYPHSHSTGCSITGGVVYRGPKVAELRQWYLYADLCGSWIKGARFVGSRLVAQRDLSGALRPPSGAWSFGVDGKGEAYVVYGQAGAVYQIVSR